MNNASLPRRATALSAIVAMLASLLASVFFSAAPASANPAGPHDPIGAAERLTAPSRTSINFVGWAADPDAMSRNARVAGFVDGNWASGVTTSIARPWITAHKHTGKTPGFSLTIPVPNDGRTHTACVAVRTIGAGLATILRCTATPLGTTLSSSQVAAHNPQGALTRVSGWTKTLHVVGHATDPDMRSRQSVVTIYVDGSAARTITTSRNTAAGGSTGPYSSFDLTLSVATGTHMACAWAVNVGIGTGNRLLGCAAGDTRGPAGSGPVSTPKANTQALAEAIKHKGQPYVWGAAGPKSFDCSGLVIYSYGKAGVTTPRVSEAQFQAARRIPASRAVPGDLVFWYDSTGDVYHVSLYVSPGRAFAAIDPAEGVDYQSLTWTTTLSYGSFTHT